MGLDFELADEFLQLAGAGLEAISRGVHLLGTGGVGARRLADAGDVTGNVLHALGRLRAVKPAGYADAIVGLYVGTALLGAVVYLYFKVDLQPSLERDRHWHALGFFDLKEDFVAIGFGLLPAYWISWHHPLADESDRTAAPLTTILAFIVWWGFLVGHVTNNVMGFGS